MLSNIWPESTFAANLRPNDTLRARYEIVSINTSKGSRPKGQPDGTNKEKNFSPCFWKPSIVAPSTTVKLSPNVKIKWDVEAKLYGTIPIKLFINIKINNAYIKGKYICPFLLLIWFITILCTVAYTDSWPIDQLFDTICE